MIKKRSKVNCYPTATAHWIGTEVSNYRISINLADAISTFNQQYDSVRILTTTFTDNITHSWIGKVIQQHGRLVGESYIDHRCERRTEIVTH